MWLTGIKEIIVIALYVFGGVSIDTHKDLYQPYLPSMREVLARAQKRQHLRTPNDSAAADVEIRLRTYQYRFEGRAFYKGHLMPGAKVILHVTTSRTAEVREAITGVDGSYSISLALEGSRNESIDWEMQAYTPDMKKVELVGRRITMREDDTVTVHKNLNLLTRPEA